VKGYKSSTSSLVPYTAASSIGIIPHCQAEEECLFWLQIKKKTIEWFLGNLRIILLPKWAQQNDATPPKQMPNRTNGPECSLYY
jgi:hypothetical protein